MTSQLTGTASAAIGVAAIILSLAAFLAQAQSVPGGSYLQSCTNLELFGNRLSADCRRLDGSWNRSVLSAAVRCDFGIVNANGRLICTAPP